MRAPLLYRLWVGVSALIVPFVAWAETRKLRSAGLPVVRAHEKLGHATEPRPGGDVIWFHAASVGESLSVLALINRMSIALPQAHFLITSGTATSAQLIAARLPRHTVHQFAPLDAPGPLKRFLSHWRPTAALFVESELWPQMLRRAADQGVKLALVNARLSQRSLAAWEKRPALSRYLFEVFGLILTQNDAMAEAMVRIHAPADRVARGINLKAMAGALPVEEDLLFTCRATLGDRPVWIASSTHDGEEESVLRAHSALLKKHPDLCLILAPRHPERGEAVARLIEDAGLCYTQRTKGGLPEAQVFLADTMGELGTWYQLSETVFLGGSLHPIGGHNPFEVAHAGAVVLAGQHVTNFAETYAELLHCGAAFLTSDADEISSRISNLLTDLTARRDATVAAQTFAKGQDDALDQIAARLIAILDLKAHG